MVWRVWGGGPPLVLLHGGTGSWMHWIRNIEELARDFTVVAPDIPGSGESASPFPQTASAPRWRAGSRRSSERARISLLPDFRWAV